MDSSSTWSTYNQSSQVIDGKGIVAQGSERAAHNGLVTGSNPVGPIIGKVAQSVVAQH